MPSDALKIFISYTQSDKDWAEWIAWQLEQAGHETIIQAWDFRPGSNLVLEMNHAAAESDRTVAVLSPRYLEKIYTQSEWASAFARDPEGKQRTLVPVRIEACEPRGLLKTVVYVDVVGKSEDDARRSPADLGGAGLVIDLE